MDKFLCVLPTNFSSFFYTVSIQIFLAKNSSDKFPRWRHWHRLLSFVSCENGHFQQMTYCTPLLFLGVSRTNSKILSCFYCSFKPIILTTMILTEIIEVEHDHRSV